MKNNPNIKYEPLPDIAKKYGVGTGWLARLCRDGRIRSYKEEHVKCPWGRWLIDPVDATVILGKIKRKKARRDRDAIFTASHDDVLKDLGIKAPRKTKKRRKKKTGWLGRVVKRFLNI